MPEKKNLRVSEDVFEEAKASKEEYGETWDEFLLRAVESPSTKGLNEEDVREIVREMVVGGALRE